MDVSNDREDIGSGDIEQGGPQVKGLRATKSNGYIGGRPPLRTSSKSSPILSTSTFNSEVPPVPLSPQGEALPKTYDHGQRPRTSQRSASNDSYRTSSSSATHVQNLRSRPSEASRLRVLSSTSTPLPADNRIPEVPDSLTRSGQTSVGENDENFRPQLNQSSTFPLQSRDETSSRAAISTSSRDRGRSTSSSRSASTFPSISLRPSMSIPDYGTADPTYSRQRNFSNYSSYRPSKGFTDTSSIASHRREPNIRANGVESEEVRASFRSALTNTSSYFGTSGTERSSVMTKSSSATSIFGRDEGMSVDDAIGMYENGFNDSGPEEGDVSRPSTSRSQRISQLKLPEPQNGSLAVPTPTNLIIRDSAAIFQEPKGLYDMLDVSSTHSEVVHDLRTNLGLSSSEQALFRPPGTSASIFDKTRDRYGFRKESQHVSRAQYEAWNGQYSEYLARRRKKWVAMLNDAGLSTEKPSSFPTKSSKLKRFVRKGIPPEWRGAAWFYYAGGPEMVAKHHGLYSRLVQKAADGEVNPTDKEIIERDLNRTFPDNIRFKPDTNVQQEKENGTRNSVHTIVEVETVILQSLRRVLQAFSIHNPRIGYCQSLNFLAGLLLLFMDEEKSFWLLNIITHDYLPGTHALNLEGANVDLGVLMASVKESMPSIWAKIGGELDGSAGSSRLSMRLPPITLCCSAWFMSCFIGTLPIETTLRVWDSFFYEGSKTLFRISLAIFKVGEVEIRAVNDPMEIFQVVQNIPRRLVDANALMEACFKRRNGFGHLSQETIEARRTERRKGYADERARANGDVTIGRKNTIFSRRRHKGRAVDVP